MTITKKEFKDRTITVAGHFGDLQLTKIAFADRWVAHARELHRLSISNDWNKTVERMMAKTRVYANIEFEQMYKTQASKS